MPRRKFFQTELKEIICKLSKKFNLSVYHQANRENFQALKAFYENKKIPFNLFDFDHSLENIFKKLTFVLLVRSINISRISLF